MKTLAWILLLVMATAIVSESYAKRNPLLVLFNGRIATMEKEHQFEEAAAIENGLIIAVGSTKEIYARYHSAGSTDIDLQGRTVIPGLNDSHIHLIREGLHYNSELRWDGVKTLKRAMAMLKEQAARTPEGVWIKVIGGWNEFQFEEKRQPTIDEINAAVPDKPVFITYLYGKAFVNKKGIAVLGYNKDTRFEGSLVELDSKGVPTGLLFAKATPKAIYTTLANTTMLNHEERLNSTIHYYRELNRFGITSAIDAGGGGQNFPDDYSVALELAKQGKLTIRTSYYLFAQVKGREYQDYERWVRTNQINRNENMFMANGYTTEGAGENIVASAADFENFLEPRIELSNEMEQDLEPVIKLLVRNRWPFRIHATYGESIERMLTVFEKVNQETPFNNLRWLFDHAETVTTAQLQRIKKLGGGIAVQFRMYYQGELYRNMYGTPDHQVPPIRQMLKLNIPVGLGTDATRISSFNPWLSLYWAITGKTIGGYQFWPKGNVLSRFEALQLYTTGSAWFSGEETVKGKIKQGQYADLVVLSADYFSVSAEAVRDIQSVLTIVNGEVVYASGPYRALNRELPAIIPSWSPVNFFGGYQSK